MEKHTEIPNRFFVENVKGVISINDLRDKEFSGDRLSLKEKQALVNFDRYRIVELNAQKDDPSFHRRYRELQVVANLGEYEEFLKDKYFIS